MKYDTIVKCDFSDFKSGKIEYKNCYLLTYNGCSEELEIDLTSDFMFNTEYKAINRVEIAKIENSIDLLNIMLREDILRDYNINTFNEILHTRKYDFENLTSAKMYVGGCKDYVLDYNLNILGWLE